MNLDQALRHLAKCQPDVFSIESPTGGIYFRIPGSVTEYANEIPKTQDAIDAIAALIGKGYSVSIEIEPNDANPGWCIVKGYFLSHESNEKTWVSTWGCEWKDTKKIKSETATRIVKAAIIAEHGEPE